MISPFADILSPSVLLNLAGERFFERGKDYSRHGAVRSLTEFEGILMARVIGTYEYRVKFQAEDDGGLRYSCSCPVGTDGLFCKHCVAVGIAWLEEPVREGQPEKKGVGHRLSMDEVRTFLEGQEKEVLVRLILEQAMEDERLQGRLMMWAARSRSEGVDLATFRRAIDDAFDPGDLLDYGFIQEFAQGIEDVVRAIAELLEEGFARETIELSEYAMAVAEGAMDYDAGGCVSGVLGDLEELHHAACKEASPDPKALAKQLFEWELRGHCDTFLKRRTPTPTCWGRRGSSSIGGSAEEQWARVRALGPGEEDPRRYGGERFRITHIMETLARQEGDVEALVGVLSRDLSGPHAYLKIAQIYREAGQSENALEWAEKAMWVFPDEVHSGLPEFLAREYHHRGRHEGATQLIWPQFARSPRLESYKELKHHAERAGRWEEWRNKALA